MQSGSSFHIALELDLESGSGSNYIGCQNQEVGSHLVLEPVNLGLVASSLRTRTQFQLGA